MTTDERAASLAVLLERVKEMANARPSLEVLYSLEPWLEWSDFWHPAYTLLLQHCEAQESQDAWRAELRRSPPDLVVWLPFHRRNNVTSASLQDAAKRWISKGPERMFAPHHHVPMGLEGVAAVHVSLLADLDPVGAVEYVAGLPSEYLVWPAVDQIQLRERQDLIDRVLAESLSGDAVLLCLASILDEQCSQVRRFMNDRGMNSLNSSTEPLVGAELKDAWAAIASRYHQFTTLLMQRHDAGAVLGPWIRHLFRCVDYSNSFDRDQRSRIGMMALQQVLEALPEGTSLELERASEPNAACLVARMLVNTRTGRGSTDWEEWQSLLLAEHDSLRSCASVGWQAAAEALLRAGDPHAVWLHTARALHPIFRRRARCHSTDVDPVVHLVMPGMYASACLGQEGAVLWSSAFELARRQFLVDRPPATDHGYRLCSYVFAACPRIFHEADVLERMLALLPTPAHVGWAREQLGESTQT